ncbi:MAG: hypothetical protein ILNGONEN_00819 [Syntrophorhabdaceae bacterium]|nr:hypothetical protein [Syntrophorhabdaceae bacterium]
METKTILKVVLSSPSDVENERRRIPGIIDELNRGIAATFNLGLELIQWEKVAPAGVHNDGPQGIIDPLLGIKESDILVGVFWKRFGTPVKNALSGTEHEINTAYECWKKHGRPQIMLYFRQDGYSPITIDDQEQFEQIKRFKKALPKAIFYWPYASTEEFERLVRNHLTQYIKTQLDTEVSHRVDIYLNNLSGKGEGKTVHGFDIHSLPITLKPGNIEFIGQETLNKIPERCFVIHGLPASGKTTIVKRILTSTSSKSFYIPIEIPPSDNIDILFIHALAKSLLKYKNETAFEHLENQGKFLFIYDGLNEAKNIYTTSRQLSALIGQLESSRFLITSRSYELRTEASLDGFKEYQIQPLSSEDHINFIKKNIKNDEELKNKLIQIFENQHYLKSMCSNQFIFIMAIRLLKENRLVPERISDFYKEFLSSFLLQWMKNKGIERMREVLEGIAYAMIRSSSSKTYLEEAKIDNLWNTTPQVCTSDEFEFLLKSSFIEKRGKFYRLFQETFQEYLLASWLIRRGIFPIHLKQITPSKWSYRDEFELSELIQRFYLELSGIKDFVTKPENMNVGI